jgi:membrane protease YdiL (CAAX protease family)
MERARIPTVQDQASAHDPALAVDRWRSRYEERVAEALASRDEPLIQRLHRFGSWSTVLVDLILLLVVEFVLSIVLVIVAVVAIALHDHEFSGGLTASTATTKLLQSAADWSLSPGGLAIGAITTQIGILTVLYFRLVQPRVMSWDDLGLGHSLREKPGRALLIGLGLGVAAYAVGLIILSILQAAHLNVSGQENTLKSVKHSSFAVFIPFAVTATVTAPLAEETFFRGYLLRAVTTRYSLAVGLLVSSVAFGALHLLGGVKWEAIALMAVGAVLGFGYARTGNLITNVTAHMFNNIIGLILLYNM